MARRKRSTQSTTLRQFFSAKPGANVPEVIIVTDDSEDEQVLRPGQRKRRCPTTKQPSSIPPSSSRAVHNSPIISSTSESSPLQSMFGQPSRLLRSNTSPPPSARGMALPLQPARPNLALLSQSISFGLASAILPPSNLEVSLICSGNSTTSASFQPHHNYVHDADMGSHVDLPLGPDNGWGTGDDERSYQSPEEEPDPEFSDLPELNTGHPCPLCTEFDDKKSPGICCTCKGARSKPPRPVSPCSGKMRFSSVTQDESMQQSSSCDAGMMRPSNSTCAFSRIMACSTDVAAWEEASNVESRYFQATKANGGRRKAPFYKVLQGMPIAVDAFRYGTIPQVNAYFLTHAHSDHYTNLSSSWKSGPIFCSEDTANLVVHMLGVDKKWIHPLPMDVPTTIPHTGGVQVTLIDANHCPGSCLFLFEGPQTVNAGDSAFKSQFVGTSRIFRYLHCGDFRASPQHVLHPAVAGKHIDHVYLDSTYLDPKYTFPPQPQVISACANLAQRIADNTWRNGNNGIMEAWIDTDQSKSSAKLKKKEGMETLFVIGTYSIGKERIVKAIAKALRTKVYCDQRKSSLLQCQTDPELHSLLTSKPLDASVHLVPLGAMTSDKLKSYLNQYKPRFNQVVGFRPTGWTYSPPAGCNSFPMIATILAQSQQRAFAYTDLHPTRNSSAELQLFPVPYSEHSSFFELTCFALSFDWGKMIATVNVGSDKSRSKIAKWFELWAKERKKRGEDHVIPFREPEYW